MESFVRIVNIWKLSTFIVKLSISTPLTTFTKISILDVWQDSEYASASSVFAIRKTGCGVGSESRINHPASIYLFKVNNRNTRKRCEMCSKVTIKTPKWHLFLAHLLLTLNKQMLVSWVRSQYFASLAAQH